VLKLENRLNSVDLEFSRCYLQYVRDKLIQDLDKIVRVLQNDGRILIYGSLGIKNSLAADLN
jgi:sulfite reductase alpha subunit-like flavoprotein